MPKIAIEKKVVVLPLIVYQKHWNSPKMFMCVSMCAYTTRVWLPNSAKYYGSLNTNYVAS